MAVFFTRRGAPPSLGTRLGDLEIGTIVHIKENGVYQDYLVVHQGIPSSMYDASCDGTWILRYLADDTQRTWGGILYGSSDINSWLNNDFISTLDDKMQPLVKQVKIPYVSGNNGTTVSSGANGLSCKAFLLSIREVGYTNSGQAVDGALLSYFIAGYTDEANERRQTRTSDGDFVRWWLRTPSYPVSAAEYIHTISNVGSFTGVGSSYRWYVRPAMVLPSNLFVDDNNNIF